MRMIWAVAPCLIAVATAVLLGLTCRDANVAYLSHSVHAMHDGSSRPWAYDDSRAALPSGCNHPPARSQLR